MSLTGLIPSFPKLTIKKNSNPNNLIWNINTNEQSTGALGRYYAQLPNVGRSSLPFNTLTVLGPEADKLDALEHLKCEFSVWAITI